MLFKKIIRQKDKNKNVVTQLPLWAKLKSVTDSDLHVACVNCLINTLSVIYFKILKYNFKSFDY